MSFLLGIGVGAEYPCGSVAASEQSEEEGIAKNAQHRWFALATSTKKTSGTAGASPHVTLPDAMIDFGFVISSFVPLVLFWMCANSTFLVVGSSFCSLPRFPCCTASAMTTFAPFGASLSGWGSFPPWLSSFGG
jgi:hypothetical protein